MAVRALSPRPTVARHEFAPGNEVTPSRSSSSASFLEIGIGDVGAKAIAASPHLKSLTKLEMFSNELGEAGKKALTKRFGDVV